MHITALTNEPFSKDTETGFGIESLVIVMEEKLTWGFILGPGNPNAAIASMVGAPKGFPPIWSIKHKDNY